MNTEKTWGQILKDPALLISFFISSQFFVLVLVFAYYPSNMDPEAKQVILQSYVVAFTAIWGYWLGSSVGSKQKDQKLAEAAGAKPNP